MTGSTRHLSVWSGIALTSSIAVLWLIACSYSAKFALVNTTDEDGTLVLRFRRDHGVCRWLPSMLLRAPSFDLERGWFRDPSPDWKSAPSDTFVVASQDCSVITRLPAKEAVSIAQIPDIDLANWREQFPVDFLSFQSATHSLKLGGHDLLDRFERRADFLYVAGVTVEKPSQSGSPPP